MRSLVTALLASLALCGAASTALVTGAHAGPGLVVGVDDDTLKWAWPGWRFIDAYEDLGLQAIRVTLHWQPGENDLAELDELYIDRVTTALAHGNRVVLAVYGGAAAAPVSPEERGEYCAFVAEALRRAPSIHDVVIWNEANSPRFWHPQRGAAAGYVALLAQCYDVLHERLHRRLNVISSTAPRHDPLAFVRALGEAYRASGRTRRIFDSFGHNPYPATNGEAPYVQHHGSGLVGEGDYPALLGALGTAFDGTGQPAPGKRGVTIWYLEDGFETAVPFEHSARYLGRERTRGILQPVLRSAQAKAAVRDQASQLRDAIALAYCQPAVGAFFNFQLVDEERLAGWQSGLLWADSSRKPSYAPFKAALGELAAGAVDCGRFPAEARGVEPAAPSQQLLSSRTCCGQSSSTSTSRSRGRARISGRTDTGG